MVAMKKLKKDFLSNSDHALVTGIRILKIQYLYNIVVHCIAHCTALVTNSTGNILHKTVIHIIVWYITSHTLTW